MGFPTGGMTVKISVAWWQTRQVGNQEPYVSMQSCELELFPHACKVSRSCRTREIDSRSRLLLRCLFNPPSWPSSLVLETVLAVKSCCCYWSASALAPKSLKVIFLAALPLTFLYFRRRCECGFRTTSALQVRACSMPRNHGRVQIAFATSMWRERVATLRMCGQKSTEAWLSQTSQPQNVGMGISFTLFSLSTVHSTSKHKLKTNSPIN